MKLARPLILLTSFSLVVAAIIFSVIDDQKEKPKAPIQYLMGGRRTGDYQGKTLSWNFSYGAIKTPTKCELILRIKFIGIPVGPLFKARVQKDIDQVWNHNMIIHNAKTGESLPLVLTIRYDGTPDQVVTIVKDTRTTMDTWTENGLATVESHEVGHMLGLFDEYKDGVTYKGFVAADGLMADALGKMYPRYYQPWLDFVGPDWSLYESKSTHETEDVNIPKAIVERPKTEYREYGRSNGERGGGILQWIFR